MPLQSFYADASRNYPTIFDYAEKADMFGRSVIDEVYYESSILADAMVKPTNDGLRERVVRRGEITDSGHVAALDEGYYGNRERTGNDEDSVGTMRVSDQIRWEHRQQLESMDNGEAARADDIKTATDNLINKKVDKLLYSNSINDQSTTKEKGKSIHGIMTYLEKCYDNEGYNKLFERTEQRKNPFTNVKDNLLSLSNYDANRTDKDSSYGTNSKFTSVVGIAWGQNGSYTIFPSILSGKVAGYDFDYKMNIESTYIDPSDGIQKSIEYDRYNLDAYFGFAVANRYALNGIRNIYLGHSKKTAIFEEMEGVENKLIMLKDFFNQGHTGMNMTFYCAPRLITQMEMYQKEKFASFSAVNGTREFDGTNPRMRPTSLRIAHDITLVSDSGFSTIEKYVSGTMSAETV